MIKFHVDIGAVGVGYTPERDAYVHVPLYRVVRRATDRVWLLLDDRVGHEVGAPTGAFAIRITQVHK